MKSKVITSALEQVIPESTVKTVKSSALLSTMFTVIELMLLALIIMI